MSEAQVQWLGSSCGQHGSYTFYKGFALNVNGEIKKYRLGEFYFVRNSEENPTCIAELQLIWYDSNSGSQYASARLYFKPQDTPFEDLEGCGQDELLYAEQKILIHCEEMSKWECEGDKFNIGNVCLCEDDLYEVNGKYVMKPDIIQSRNHFCRPCLKGRKFLILSYPAYCRYHAVRARLLAGAALSRPLIMALGGIITKCRDTRIAYCRDNFSHPEIEKFSFSSGIKAPVLKGRPRKKTVKGITLSKALKKRKMLIQLSNKQRLNSESQMSDSESVDTVQSDLSEDSTKSHSSDSLKTTDYENMDMESSQTRFDDSDEDTKHTQRERKNSILQEQKSFILQEQKNFILQEQKNSNLQEQNNFILQEQKNPILQEQKNPILQEQKNSILQEFYDLKPTTRIDVVKVREEVTENLQPLQTVQNNNLSDIDFELLNIFKRDKKRKCIEEDPKIPIKKEKLEKVETDLNENIPLKDQKPINGSTKCMEELRKPGNFNSADERIFMDSLLTFMNTRKTPIGKIPALGFKKVNLYALFTMAQSLGGYEQVTEKRMWRRLYKELGGHTTITSAATTLRRHYERLLLPYEQHVTGRTILTKDENKTVDSPVKREANGFVKADISEENKALVKSILSDKNNYLHTVSKTQGCTTPIAQEYKMKILAGDRVQEQTANVLEDSRLHEQKEKVLLDSRSNDQKIPVVTQSKPKQWNSQIFDKTQDKRSVVMENKRVNLQDTTVEFSSRIESTKIKDVEIVLQPVRVPTIVRNSSVKQPPKLVESRKPPSPQAREQLRVKKPNNCTPPMPKLVKITDQPEGASCLRKSPWNQVIEIGSDTEGSCDSDDSEQDVGVIQSKRPNANLQHSKDSYTKHDNSHSNFGYRDVHCKQDKQEQECIYPVSPLMKQERMNKQDQVRSPSYPEKRSLRPNILSRASPYKDNLQNDLEMTYLSFPVMDNHVIVDSVSLSGINSYYSHYYSPYYSEDSPPSSTGSISPKRSKSRIFMPQPQFYPNNLPSISSSFMTAYETPSSNLVHPGHCLVGSPHSYQYVHGIPVASPNGSIY